MPSQEFPRKFEMSFANYDPSKISCIIDAVPRKIHINTKTKYKFKCNKCNSFFELQINKVVKGEWCSCIKVYKIP
tara:strand:+ start:1016 stop:1240 length:225 start_codon:yes stop_codon:yes gene_type:complete